MNRADAAPPPLTPSVFAILLALADGEKHGYAIMQEVRPHTPMGPGTLYGSLDRLLAAALIAETRGTALDDPRRRTYRLTASGRKALTTEAARLEQALSRVRGKGIRTTEAIV